ncbi:MAG TPA: translocation/assembly module TamB domain-containing protein [Azospirillum sp.]|nr:translocation/assembly module TamB domain-containing protein [Azospirillum sp.]
MKGFRILLCGLAALGVAAGAAMAQDDAAEKSGMVGRWITGVIERAVSGPDMEVRLGALRGMVPFNFTVSQVTVADRGGVWLRIEELHLNLAPTALFTLRAKADVAEAARVVVERAPLPAENAPPPEPPQDGVGGLLPDLPVGIVVDRFAVQRLELPEALLGEAAVLKLEGSADLEAGGSSVSLRLDVARIDQKPGQATLNAAFDPGSERLDLDLKASEPAGGVIARALSIPGLPPVAVALDGQGTLTDWHGTLTATAEGTAQIEADAAIKAAEGGHVVTLAAAGDVAGLLPPPAADLVGPRPQVKAEVLVGADRALTLRPVTVTAAAATATLTGRVAPDFGSVALEYDVAAGEDSSLHALAPVHWRTAQAKGTAEGPLDAVLVTLGAVATDVAADDPTLGPLAGSEVRLDARAQVRPDGGRVRLDALTLATAAGTASAQGNVSGWGQAVDATVRLALDDLSRLSAVAGQPLAGAAVLEGPVEVANGAARADLNGTVTSLATGTPADALLGDTVRLAASAAAEPDGTMRLTDVRVEGARATLTGAVALAGGAVDAEATLALPELAPVGDALATPMRGAATVDLTAKGPLDAIEAEVKASARDLEVQGRRFGATELTATAAGLPASPRGRVRATSAFAGLGLDVGGEYALDGQVLRLTDLAVANGANRVKGAVTVALDTLLASGRLEGRLPELRALSELAGVPLRGDATFTVALDNRGGKQAATLTAAADGLRAEGEGGPLLAARRLTVNAEVADALGTPTGKARVEMRDGAVAGTELASFTASADGGLAKAGFQATATGAGAGAVANLDLAGTFSRDGALNRIRLERLRAAAAGESVRLVGPATIELGERHYRVADLTLASGTARLSADAALTGDRISGDVRVNQLPLALARLIDPTLRLDGVINADATLGGTLAAPRAEVTLRGNNLRAAQLTQQGIAGLDVNATARWRDARLAVDGTVTARGGEGRLALKAGMPLRLDPDTMAVGVPEGGRLDGTVTGNIQLARFNDLLATTGDRMQGVLDLNVRIAGTVADPQLGGAVTLTGGRYENQTSGAVISDITARITGTGDVFTIQSFTGRTPNGGTVTASGVIRPKPGEARAVDVRLRAQNARLLQTDTVTATLAAELTVAGSFQRVTIAGPLHLLRAEVRVPDRMPPNVVDLEVVEVGGNRTGSTGPAPARADGRSRTDGAPRPGRKPGAPPPPPPDAAPPAEEAGLVMALDISVEAPNQIFVRGRGLEAEFGGQLHVSGTVAQPVVTGRLNMLKGTLDLLARSFVFRRGIIEFDGNPEIDPRLDFLAEATANQVTAQVQVTGTAKQPKLELTSPQGLPQDEVLARVLFGKPVNQLGAAEAVQLAQSAATLAGYGGGTGILDRVRTTLGVDRLGFTQGEDGKGGAVEAGRYINDRVYVGVEQGVAGNAQSRAKVEVDITDNIQVEADVGANADTRVGVKFEWEY